MCMVMHVVIIIIIYYYYYYYYLILFGNGNPSDLITSDFQGAVYSNTIRNI